MARSEPCLEDGFGMRQHRRMTGSQPFKSRLAELIELRGFKNRAAFLRAANLENQTVARWERGETSPRGALLIRAADALGVPVGALLGTEPIPESVERVDSTDGDAMLEEVRAMMGATDAEIRWLASAPRFHQQSVGSLIDTLRVQRQGMTAAQERVAREETERFRDTRVPRRAKKRS